MRSAISECGSRAFFMRSILLLASIGVAQAHQIDIPAPPGSHGVNIVAVLPNGNFVAADSSAGDANQGAVYLYSPSATLISTLRGNAPNDAVGGVIVLPSGDFLVATPTWHNGDVQSAGAVTWVDGTHGLEGVVTAANSLVGSSEYDEVGHTIVVLANGGCVVATPGWRNGTAQQAGAATFVPADGGVHGEVSAANSLVGVSPYDSVGASVVPLTNGNYLVVSQFWTNGDVVSAGAVTWGSGKTGIAGTISAANSLVGTTARDRVGAEQKFYAAVWPLPNGNAVVISPDWDNGTIADAGAATWIDGAAGLAGPLSEANSLVGTTADDHLGAGGLGYGFAVLPGGRYAVISSGWSAPGAAHVGAITWGDAAAGVRGVVSASNSLVGSSARDLTLARVFALSDGNWVVGSPYWSNADVMEVGAATWIDGNAPLVGAISTANSLVGTSPADQVGTSVAALRDGRYVVASPTWNNASVAQAGAVTWVDPASTRVGTVSAANSLVGSTPGDAVGTDVTVLANGNYLVLSPHWINDGATRAGAVTWARGVTGVAGPVSPDNSLVGDAAEDYVGELAVPLANGSAVTLSPLWHGERGAATWIDGETGRSGIVSAANSLIGSAGFQTLSSVVAFDGTGNYLVVDPDWNDLLGAVAWGDGRDGLVGEISAANSLVGTSGRGVARDVVSVANGNVLVAGDASVTLVRGTSPTVGTPSAADSALNPLGHAPGTYVYDAARDRVFVGWRSDDHFSIFQTESLLKDGFD
jgi:hypothetical protein